MLSDYQLDSDELLGYKNWQELKSPERRTRYLEVVILVRCLLLSTLLADNDGANGLKSMDNWQEDLADELALNYSVDVRMPEKFIDWLYQLKPLTWSTLEILGLLDDDDDDEENDDVGGDGGGDDDSNDNSNNEKEDKDEKVKKMEQKVGDKKTRAKIYRNYLPLEYPANFDALPYLRTKSKEQTNNNSKRRRVQCIRRDSNGSSNSGETGSGDILADGRYLIEVERTPTIPGLLVSLPNQSIGKESATANTMNTISPGISTPTIPVDSSNRYNINNKKQSARRTDTTIILATPPRAINYYPLHYSSHSSSQNTTPGCSQRVQALSLEDNLINQESSTRHQCTTIATIGSRNNNNNNSNR